jgi:hypothetical protein
MWTWVWILGGLTILLLLARMVERRVSGDAPGEEEMAKIMRGRLGRGDSSGPNPSDGAGAGDGGG